MPSIPGGKPVRPIPDMKRPASPHDRGNPRPSPRPEGRRPYQAAKPQVDNAAGRRAELAKHTADLRTDAPTGKRY